MKNIESKKGQIALAIFAILIVIGLVALFLGMKIGKEVMFQIKQPIVPVKKLDIAFNSLLRVNNTRRHLVYSLSGIDSYDGDIKRVLNLTFPKRCAEIIASEKTLSNDNEKGEYSLNITRKILLPLGNAEEVKLKMWNKPE